MRHGQKGWGATAGTSQCVIDTAMPKEPGGTGVSVPSAR